VVDDLSNGSRRISPVRVSVELVRGDIRDAALMDDCMRGVSRVLHLAALAQWRGLWRTP
jgi:UDP-glucose 4-epimerase